MLKFSWSDRDFLAAYTLYVSVTCVEMHAGRDSAQRRRLVLQAESEGREHLRVIIGPNKRAMRNARLEDGADVCLDWEALNNVSSPKQRL